MLLIKQKKKKKLVMSQKNPKKFIINKKKPKYKMNKLQSKIIKFKIKMKNKKIILN